LLCHLLVFFADQSKSWINHLDAKYYTAIVLFCLLIFLSIAICVYRRNLNLSAILLNQSARFLGNSTRAFSLILVFVVITTFFIFLNIVVQWILLTSSAASTNKSDVWQQWSGNKPLQIIHIILFLWGIQFLKDSCKMIYYYSQLFGDGYCNIMVLYTKNHTLRNHYSAVFPQKLR
jgi:hypothetical protein